VNAPIKVSSCATYDMSSRRLRAFSALPLNSTLPVSLAPLLRRRNASASSSDVLPDPEGPMIVSTWPGSTMPLQSRSTSLVLPSLSLTV
jgi:hypothetical protein